MTNLTDNPEQEKKILYVDISAQLVKSAYGLWTLSRLS